MEPRVCGAPAIDARDYHRVFAFNPHPMWVFDLDSLALLDVNDAAVGHYGYSRQEFLRMTIRDIRPADDVPRLIRHLPTTRDSPAPPTTLWRHVKKDGALIDVEITSFKVGFEGRPAKIVMVNDVTARSRTTDAAELLTFVAAGLRELSRAESLSAAREIAAELSARVFEALEGVTRFMGGGRSRSESPSDTKELSRREREVLARIAEGHTNREVAEELGLSIKSVEAYRARVMHKLGIRSRAELVRYSLERGVLRPANPRN